MVGKMSKIEKMFMSLSFALLLVAIVVRGIMGTADVGVWVILSFAGILVWVIFLVCAFFPADWRMTKKQKSKINNLTEYQDKYRRIILGVDVVISIIFAVLILMLG